MFACGAAVITGGVGASQALGGIGWRGVDWTVFEGCLAAAALIVLFWRFGPVDWIDDREIVRMEEAELRTSLVTEAGQRRFLWSTRFWTAVIALILGVRWVRLLGGRRMLNASSVNLNGATANGGSGASVMDFTFGSFHLLGRDWTGLELAVIVPLLIFLGVELWNGIAHIVRANRGRP